MGLRETKAARTHERVLEVALKLFGEQGYEATTMEQVAEQAEIGATTLYRYFPTKDMLLLGQFRRCVSVAEALRARPEHEPLDLALGQAVQAALDSQQGLGGQRILQIRRIIDLNPVPRARLWDVLAGSADEAAAAVAERLALPVGDPVVVLTTDIALIVFSLASDLWRAHPDDQTMSDQARALMGALATGRVPFPRA
ncbi:MAG: TetR/AcrR family transcriptional regulator [Propionibacteriaceae bacterium]|jgi:AcrR family transcriptional regulator|nr:TetR/AcrR family transcriptional regulator [Propionibacteriaceae bacterium]